MRGNRPALPITHVATTPEEKAEDKARDRNALQRLIATPEIVASCVWLFLMIVFGTADAAGSGAFVLILVITAITALLVYLTLRSGDSVIVGLILAGTGFFTALTLGVTISVPRGSLWWLLPALAIIATENAISFNFYRRRSGEISRAIQRTQAQNLGATLVGSVLLGLFLRTLSGGNGQVSWIWFAAVSATIAALVIGSLVVVRRHAVPADRRRFSPGRRMIPPPS